MAKSFATLALAAGLLGVLAGCQAQSQQHLMVDSLPPQDFTGPGPAAPAVPAAPAPSAPVKPVAPLPPAVANKGGMMIPREWVPLPNAEKRQWKWIIIHHSATPTGGAAAFDRMHKAKGWDELGYHFVIGNGTDTRNGLVEVGPRWPVQKHGAHDKTPDNQYNEHGIGICLVGNFDLTNPSSEQMKSVARLVAYLSKKYNIPPERILGHGQTKSTDCPGKYLNIAEVRRQSARVLADSGETVPVEIAPPMVESLLHTIPAN
jgi:N-acetylmuramoyl-L-alanine amidase